jgi:hypothetical protein
VSSNGFGSPVRAVASPLTHLTVPDVGSTAAIGTGASGSRLRTPHCSLSAVELLRSYPVLLGHASANNMIAMAIAATRPEGVRRGGGGCVIAESFSIHRVAIAQQDFREPMRIGPLRLHARYRFGAQ